MEATMFSTTATKTRVRFASARSIGRVLGAALLTFSLMGTAACGGDDKKDSTGPGTVAGTYSLKSVANVNVPVRIWEGTIGGQDVEYQVRDGQVELKSNGTFVMHMTVWEIVDGDKNDIDIDAEGTFTRSGGEITFTSDGDDLTGTLSNGTITVQLDLLEIGEDVGFAFKK